MRVAESGTPGEFQGDRELKKHRWPVRRSTERRRKREEAQDLKKLKDPDKPDMSVHFFIRNSIQLWLFSVMLACFLVLQPKGLNSH